jgi:hypothetical protein
MPWLILSWFISLGVTPQQDNFIATADRLASSKLGSVAMTTDVEIKAEAFRFIRIWGSTNVYEYLGRVSLLPFRADFVMGASVFWGPLELKIEHECDHAIIYTLHQYPQYWAQKTKISLIFLGKTAF